MPAMRIDHLEQPHPSRLEPSSPWFATIVAAHERAVSSGLSTYLDPATGLTVLTAGYLADRGYCCDGGCRHCPYVGAVVADDE